MTPPITLFTQKMTGPMQQHLRLYDFNVHNINTFGEVREIVSNYLNSRHLTVPSVRNDDGPADMDVGKGRQEGKEEKSSRERCLPRTRPRQRNVQRQEMEREKVAKE